MTATALPDVTPLERALGHHFADPALLRHALTHSSVTADRLESNERLEFLGDRVLGLVIAEMLFDAYAEEAEGALGYRFTALARAEALVRVARDIGLGDHLILSDSERDSGGADKEGLLADSCEAIIAALYLDGGMDAARTFIRRHWTPLMAENLEPAKDPKTQLQEWAQARGLALPGYEVVGRAGPDHAPTFTVAVQVNGEPPARAEGTNKRAAEQAAAAKMLRRVSQDPGA